MSRFSSKEGYRAFHDAIPTSMEALLRSGMRRIDADYAVVQCLRNEMNILTAVVSNADSRIRASCVCECHGVRHPVLISLLIGLAMEDLDFPASLEPIVLSEEEGIEKPCTEIFLRTIARANTTSKHLGSPIRPEECLHVGDELLS
jgi:hypothetical protein